MFCEMKKYTVPEQEVICFTVEDVITTSSIPDSGLDKDELPLVPVG